MSVSPLRTGVWLLSWRRLQHTKGQTATLIACIALTIFLPLATQLVTDDYERELVARADATPLVAGTRGNRVDLALAALYFRETELDPIPMAAIDELGGGKDLAVQLVPVHVRFTAQGRPLVGTVPEYYERRALVAAAGSTPLVLGDVCLGANAARALGLGPGDALFSDQRELYDISKPPALKMRVSGVLAANGTPDDDAVFVDVKTAWILEGLSHGHQDVEEGIDPTLVIGETDDMMVVSPAMIEYNEVTPETLATFHVHGDPADLPLTAVLAFPATEKDRTMLRAHINVRTDWQMISPREVIDDLMEFVFRIRSVLNGVFALLAVSTAMLVGLVVLLSTRLRAAEMETLHRIGCPRSTVLRLYAAEWTLILGAATALAALGTLAATSLLPNLVRTL